MQTRRLHSIQWLSGRLLRRETRRSSTSSAEQTSADGPVTTGPLSFTASPGGFNGDWYGNTATMSDNDSAIEALVRAYIACRLAIEALPDLPADIRAAVTEPVTTLCHIVGPELDRLKPGFLEEQPA